MSLCWLLLERQLVLFSINGRKPGTLKNELAIAAVHFKGNTAWPLFE